MHKILAIIAAMAVCAGGANASATLRSSGSKTTGGMAPARSASTSATSSSARLSGSSYLNKVRPGTAGVAAGNRAGADVDLSEYARAAHLDAAEDRLNRRIDGIAAEAANVDLSSYPTKTEMAAAIAAAVPSVSHFISKSAGANETMAGTYNVTGALHVPTPTIPAP